MKRHTGFLASAAILVCLVSTATGGTSAQSDQGQRQAADALTREAVVLLRQGSPFAGEAREKYLRALALWEALGDRPQIATTLQRIGSTYVSSDEHQRALEYQSRALALWRAIGDRRGEATTLYAMARAYELNGDPQRARDVLLQALPMHQAEPDRLREADVLNQLGVTSYRLRDDAAALGYLDRALALHQAARDHSGTASDLTYKGFVLERLKRTTEAVRSLEAAIEAGRAAGGSFDLGLPLTGLGSIHRTLGDHGKALAVFQEALAIRLARRVPRTEAVARWRVAQAQQALGNLAEARAELERTLAIVESVRGQFSSDDLRASYFANNRPYYVAYIEVLMAQARTSADPSREHGLAFQVCERARARSLLDLMVESRVDLQATIDPATRARQLELETSVSRTQRTLLQETARSSPRRDEVARLEASLAQARDDQRQLEWSVRRQHREYADIYYAEPLSLEAVRVMLDPSTALLEYCVGLRESYLFVVSHDGVRAHVLPSGAELNALVREFRSTIDRPGQLQMGRYVSAARRLYDAAIAPAADGLADKKTLLIAADNALSYVPYEALLTTAPAAVTDLAAQPYLVKRWAVGYVPSASVLASLRARARAPIKSPSSKAFVAVADPLYGAPGQKDAGSSGAPAPPRTARPSTLDQVRQSAATPLPGTREEVANIARRFARGDTMTYLGRDASEDTVKRSPELATARRVHFATHAVVDESDPARSGLLLAPGAASSSEDGWLQLPEIFNLRLSADLVVLSACSTGLGRELRGEGIVGLTRAFLYAGASTVAVSLWPVADRSTSDLMSGFYARLESGKLDALRQAKLDLIRNSAWSHPYYWAPFIAVGDPR